MSLENIGRFSAFMNNLHMVRYCTKIGIFKRMEIFILSMEESSLFIQFMGDSPMIRVLDYLLTERELDFSITDLAKNAGIGRSTLYRIWDGLVKNSIILPTRIIGKAKLFKLNKDNAVIQKLIEVDDKLVLEDLKKRAQKVKVA